MARGGIMNVKCPYCDKEMDYYLESPYEDGDSREIECAHCSKIFLATVLISVDMTNERRADYLN
jgi:hypothetical protein